MGRVRERVFPHFSLLKRWGFRPLSPALPKGEREISTPHSLLPTHHPPTSSHVHGANKTPLRWWPTAMMTLGMMLGRTTGVSFRVRGR